MGAPEDLRPAPSADEKLRFLCREAAFLKKIEDAVLRVWREEQARQMPPVCADLFGEIYDVCQQGQAVCGRAMLVILAAEEREELGVEDVL